ncbi:MAG: hypothetical protein AB7G12_05665 [Thermoanaerobaculia bacterium]
MSRIACLPVLGALLLAGCDGNVSTTEHLLLRWTEALNLHLASSFADGNRYPERLVDVDPMLRLELGFDDAWGSPLQYRRINDSQFDLASSGPDSIPGNADDIVIQDRVLKKAETAYGSRPFDKRFAPQRAADTPSSDSEAELWSDDDSGYEDEEE